MEEKCLKCEHFQSEEIKKNYLKNPELSSIEQVGNDDVMNCPFNVRYQMPVKDRLPGCGCVVLATKCLKDECAAWKNVRFKDNSEKGFKIIKSCVRLCDPANIIDFIGEL